MESNLGSFRDQLQQVREQLGPRVLLSRLGIALRAVDPAFTPGTYGGSTLGELLRRVPDVGHVETLDGERIFVFAGAGPAPRGPARLQADVWRAVTDFKSDAGLWHIDLETFVVRHSSQQPEELLRSESERFVALPALALDFQKALARAFIREHAPAQAEAAETALSGDHWTSAFLQILEHEGLAERWRIHRQSRITEEVLKWADQHGIPRERVVEAPGTAMRRSAASGAGTPAGDDLSDMRALIHEAIDMMSLPELAALSIPPAYLALAASRRRR